MGVEFRVLNAHVYCMLAERFSSCSGVAFTLFYAALVALLGSYIKVASIDIYTLDIFFVLPILLAKTQRITVMTISGKVLPTIISTCIRSL